MASFRDRLAAFANSKLGWKVITHIMKLHRKMQSFIRFARRHHALNETEDFYARVKSEFSDQTVRHGPFKGLRYGNMSSRGSTLLPKLLGSYENEIHSHLETLLKRPYKTVLDIGCAEGYYAVGLARLLPDAKIFAYDVEESSRNSCRELAALNGVLERLKIGAFCSSENLKTFDYVGRTLIISDCEGYETQLFIEDVIPFLSQVDLIIECHDHILGEPVTRTLIEAFSKTHQATVIHTTADHRKALDLDLPELTGKPYQMRLYMVEEMREAPQDFLLLETRQTA